MNRKTTALAAEAPRDAGLDTIKAVSILLVVIWHIQPVRIGGMFSSAPAAVLSLESVVRFFYLHITLLAVPAFLLVSLYLFILKSLQQPVYWKKRLIRLVQIYIFWVGVQFILYLLLGGGLPLPLKTVFRSGGPDLPIGPSIFYYLFILMECTVLAALFLRLPEKLKQIVAIIIVAVSLIHFSISPVQGIGIDTRSMDNYYIYIPAAYYLCRYRNVFVRFRRYILGCFFLAATAETALMGITSAYGRVSVFLGALSLCLILIDARPVAPRSVSFLSRYSLGIFAVHLYWRGVVKNLPAYWYGQADALKGQSTLEGTLSLIAVFVLSCSSVYLLGKTGLRKYVA